MGVGTRFFYNSFLFLFIPCHSFLFLENSLKIPWIIPFHSFSFLAEHFFERFLPKSLHVSILLPNFAIATITMRSTPHNRRARRYVQAQPTFLLRCGLIFLPIHLPHKPEARPSIMRSTPHKVWRCNQDIRRFAFHVFFGPSWRISMVVVADEEVRSAFFRTLSSTAPDGFGG